MRILYLGARGSHANNATGQTLRCLYSAIPSADVLELVYDADSANDATNVFVIPESSAPADAALRAAIKVVRRSGRSTPQTIAPGLNDAIKNDTLTVRNRLWRDVRAAADVSPVRLPAALLARVAEFRPTVLHTLLGNVRIMKLALALSVKFDIPIVPHFMDDWPRTLYPNGELRNRARSLVKRALANVIARSPVLLCIGDKMAAEYGERYARPTHVAAYGIDQVSTPRFEARPPGGTRRLVYAGGLHLARQEVLEWVGSQLAPSHWSVDVFTSVAGPPNVNIRYRPEVSVDRVAEALADADALLFMESLLPSIADYTQLSVSTKTAQYVGANRPVVLIGPPGQASLDVLSESLGSMIRIESLSPVEGTRLLEYLEAGIPKTMEATTIPAALSGGVMRDSMIEAFTVAQKRWQQRGSWPQ